jgi:hypothetical protein
MTKEELEVFEAKKAEKREVRVACSCRLLRKMLPPIHRVKNEKYPR